MRLARVAFGLAVALLMVLVGPAASHGSPRVDSRTFVAATFIPPEIDCRYRTRSEPSDLENDLGNPESPTSPQGAYQQACFDIEPGEGNFSLRVHDVTARHVYGWYLFLDADEYWLDRPYAPFFCDAAAGAIPPDAAQLFVVLWGFESECPHEGISYTRWSATTVGSLAVAFGP